MNFILGKLVVFLPHAGEVSIRPVIRIEIEAPRAKLMMMLQLNQYPLSFGTHLGTWSAGKNM
jgi:hypothetical protein